MTKRIPLAILIACSAIVCSQTAFDASAAAAGTALTSSYQWQFVGPEPIANETANFGGVLFTNFPPLIATGRVTAIAVDPQVSGRFFVGTADGGLWMTTDGGSTFTLISASLPSQAIGAIAIDSVNTNPSTIDVATGEGNNCAFAGHLIPWRLGIPVRF